ncbi:MAG: hypothetical protein V3T88_07050 [Nitrosomonadaceae bacterium]
MTWGLVAVGGATIVSGVIQSGAISGAAESGERGTAAGIAEQRRQFDIAQQLQQPFLQAAVGTQNQLFNPQSSDPQEAIQFVLARQRGEVDTQGFEIDAQGNRTGGTGALQAFQAGIEQAPDVPILEQFQGQAVAAPDIQRFGGQAVGAPTLEQFQFDPRAALESPALQFQQEQGQRAVERVAGQRRQLGSGQRLIAAQEFGQGLASQSIEDEFRRQLQTAQQRGGTQERQFGLSTQQLGQEQTLNQLANQQAIQQQGLQRQELADRLGLSQTEQNRLLTQFGLTSGQFNERLNRLAGLVDVGARTGSALGAGAQQTGANISNLLAAQGQQAGAAQLGQANVLGGTIQQLAGLAGQSGIFNQPQVTTTSTPVVGFDL